MKNQKHVNKKKTQYFGNLTQELKNMFQNKKKKRKEYGKNFQLQMTENQQTKKEKMNLNKKLMVGKMIWQILKSMESKSKNSQNFSNVSLFTLQLNLENYFKLLKY